jgi:SAM-dependent methyltransferase
MKRGDRATDELYHGMRSRHGRGSARANGYRYEAYFRREQAVLLSLLDRDAPLTVDACCGSGLMLLPLVGGAGTVFGIDFNADACAAARANGFPVVRGDAYRLPLADGSVAQMTNCQFFNQQDAAGVDTFLAEVARVLAPGGRLVLVWRNGSALIHRLAHALLTVMDRLRGMNVFPQHVHALETVAARAAAVGLEVVHRELSCPPLGWRTTATAGLAGRIAGASCVLVLRRPA